ncbi:MAG: hypothetical protein QXI77_01250 [Nanopusillaceae archaeon]
MRYFVKKEDEAFITVDGQKLYTLQDLILWLMTCSDESFRYHVNEKSNHFVDWIKNSIGSKILAEEIKKVYKKEEMIKILENFICGIRINKEEILEEI